MNIRHHVLTALITATLISACSDSSAPVASDKPASHVWQSQTDALQEAKTTADDLSKSLQLREDRSRPEN
jgi:outer membrane biogenesis lipoprotein LolB